MVVYMHLRERKQHTTGARRYTTSSPQRASQGGITIVYMVVSMGTLNFWKCLSSSETEEEDSSKTSSDTSLATPSGISPPAVVSIQGGLVIQRRFRRHRKGR